MDQDLLTEARSTISWIIAAYPDDETSKKIEKYVRSLKIKGNKKYKSYYHCTLRYWKKTPKSLVTKVIEALKEFGDTNQIVCDISKLEVLGNDHSLVLRFNNPKMTALQKKIDKAIMKVGVPPSTYPTFKGHLTIATEFSGELPKAPDFKLKFSKFRLMNNEDELLWRL